MCGHRKWQPQDRFQKHVRSLKPAPARGQCPSPPGPSPVPGWARAALSTMGTSSVLGGKARAERRGRRWARLDMFELVVRFPHTGACPVGELTERPAGGRPPQSEGRGGPSLLPDSPWGRRGEPKTTPGHLTGPGSVRVGSSLGREDRAARLRPSRRADRGPGDGVGAGGSQPLSPMRSNPLTSIR